MSREFFLPSTEVAEHSEDKARPVLPTGGLTGGWTRRDHSHRNIIAYMFYFVKGKLVSGVRLVTSSAAQTPPHQAPQPGAQAQG